VCNLIYHLGSVSKNTNYLNEITSAILDLRLKNVDQINAALAFADSLQGPWVNETFEEASGVGIIVTRDQVKEAVLRISKEKLSDINAKRY
jgi:hypothetical protein